MIDLQAQNQRKQQALEQQVSQLQTIISVSFLTIVHEHEMK